MVHSGSQAFTVRAAVSSHSLLLSLLVGHQMFLGFSRQEHWSGYCYTVIGLFHWNFLGPGAHPGVDSSVVSTQPRPYNAGPCCPFSQGQALAAVRSTPAHQERAREQRLGLRPWTQLLAQSTAYLLLQRDRLGPQRLGAQPQPAGSLGGAPESSACHGNQLCLVC